MDPLGATGSRVTACSRTRPADACESTWTTSRCTWPCRWSEAARAMAAEPARYTGASCWRSRSVRGWRNPIELRHSRADRLEVNVDIRHACAFRVGRGRCRGPTPVLDGRLLIGLH